MTPNNMVRGFIAPDFYIVGAPKCGTTAVSEWLMAHPGAYIPSQKELNHFNEDLDFPEFRDPVDYAALFETDKKHQKNGDGSVWYLYSNCAIENIEKHNSASQYIVCLRNPVELAVSLYVENRYATTENLGDFWTAWQYSDFRARGEKISTLCREPKLLDYKRTCLLGQQLEVMLQHVEPHRIHFIFLEDIKVSPLDVYKGLLAFLGLDYDGREEFVVVNAAKRIRFPAFKRLVRLIGTLRSKVPFGKGFGFLKMLNRYNVSTDRVEKPQLSNEMLEEMAAFFESDIQLLSALTGRNLDHWRVGR